MSDNPSIEAMQEFAIDNDGKRIYGKIAFPSGEASCPLVIFSHGFSASRVYDSGMERPFVEKGMAFIAFDFCGAGPGSQSSGTMLEMSVLTEASDLNAVMDWACALDRIDKRHVFLLGSSQGGYVSTYVAAGRPEDVAALGLFFPAFNIGDDAHARLAERGGPIPAETRIGEHVVGRRYIEDALSVDIFDRMAAYPGDVFIVHGALDEIVPVENSYRAMRAFGGSCRLEIIDELGHGFRAYPFALCEQAHQMMLDFFIAHSAS